MTTRDAKKKGNEMDETTIRLDHKEFTDGQIQELLFRAIAGHYPPTLSALLENRESSTTSDEWSRILEYLVEDWNMEVDFWSHEGSTPFGRCIPEQESRDRLEAIARIHDIICYHLLLRA